MLLRGAGGSGAIRARPAPRRRLRGGSPLRDQRSTPAVLQSVNVLVRTGGASRRRAAVAREPRLVVLGGHGGQDGADCAMALRSSKACSGSVLDQHDVAAEDHTAGSSNGEGPERSGCRSRNRPARVRRRSQRWSRYPRASSDRSPSSARGFRRTKRGRSEALSCVTGDRERPRRAERGALHGAARPRRRRCPFAAAPVLRCRRRRLLRRRA